MSEKILAESILELQPIMQLIVFRVGDEEFGVPIEAVQEIIKVGAITPIPDMPQFIKGLINVRGDIVPTIDVRLRFTLPVQEEISKHIVITKQEGSLFGLIVDEVTEVLRIHENEIKPPPKLINKAHEEYVSGVFASNGRLIVLLDLTKVLSETDLSKIMDAGRKNKRIAKAEVTTSKKKKGNKE